MTSRTDILEAIRASRPDPQPEPALPDVFGRIEEPLADRFQREVERAGGDVLTLPDRNAVSESLQQKFRPSLCWTPIDDLTLPGEQLTLTNAAAARRVPHSRLGKLELVVLPGELGVAENGAVWIRGDHLPLRILPFITLDLVLVMSVHSIVENLHIAYDRIDDSQTDFGVFISGPSKTADIEQSLVMGAHGPRSTTICLTDETPVNQRTG